MFQSKQKPETFPVIYLGSVVIFLRGGSDPQTPPLNSPLLQDDKGGMGNSLCKVPFQRVCPTNGYATEQPKGSFDHGKHKDELCTLNSMHDSHAYCQQMGGCYVKFCPDTLHNYSCPQPEVNDPSSSSIDPMSSVLITA